MVAAAQYLEQGGADFIMICSNTMHKLAEAVQQQVPLPLLHIADVTAQQIVAQGLHTVGLLGTKFTMEQDFYTRRLTDRYGLEVMVPDAAGRAIAHNIIYNELCLGQIQPESKVAYQSLIESLVAQGAQGIILGCTEIMLLIQQADSPVPLLDTTAIHAIAAADYALQVP